MPDEFESHVEVAFWENYQFLSESGLSDEWIAKRLNVSEDVLQKRKERRKARAKCLSQNTCT